MPDVAGRYVVFVSDRQRRQNIYLYDIQENRLVDLPGLNSLTALVSEPDISADGRYLVFVGNRRNQSGIYIYDRETRQVRELAPNLQEAVRNPSISADGSTIAFEAVVNGQWDVVVFSRSGRPIEVPNPPPF
jgi:Tol biopolymer transport system component